MGQLINVPGGIGLDLVPSPIQAIMLNTIQCLTTNSSLRSASQLIEMTNPEFVFLDSGGFTLFKKEQARERIFFDRSRPVFVSGGFNLSDVHPFLAAKKINPTDMIQLDSPVADVLDSGERQFLYMKAAYFNIENAWTMARLKEQHLPNIRLYGALQVYSHQQFDSTMMHLDGIQLDGWSIPVRALAWNHILSFIIRFKSLGYRRIHILGSYALDIILIAAFSAQHLIEGVVSFDSTSWRFYAELEYFLIPIDLRAVRLKLHINLAESIIKFKCVCPHCAGLSVGEIRQLPYSQKRQLLALHNFWCVDTATKIFYSLAVEPNSLQKYLLQHSNRRRLISKIIKAFNIILSVRDRLHEPNFNRNFAQYIYDLRN